MKYINFREGYVDSRKHVSIKEEVLNVIENIKVDKSSGPEEIYPRLLYEVG